MKTILEVTTFVMMSIYGLYGYYLLFIVYQEYSKFLFPKVAIFSNCPTAHKYNYQTAL